MGRPVKTFQAPATLTSVSSTADGGVRLNFHTQELDVGEKVIAMGYHGAFGYVLFKPNEFSDADIPEDDATDDGKSPSKRLRAVIFCLWKQRGEKGDFEVFYRRAIEKAINRIKDELD